LVSIAVGFFVAISLSFGHAVDDMLGAVLARRHFEYIGEAQQQLLSVTIANELQLKCFKKIK
jgi:hypothetical protein